MLFKKILIIITLLLFSTISISNANYSISDSDKTQVDKVVVKVNKYIDDKGERYRNILISKLNKIINKKSMSIRVTSIYKYFLESLKLSEEIESDNEKLSDDISLYNENEARDYRLSLLNSVRDSNGLEKFKYNSSLDYTSQKWTNLSVVKGNIDHKVDVGDSYYDYGKKQKRMEDNGVLCENVNRITFSESIAWGQFYCNKNDCTDGIKQVLKNSYDFYISEKGKEYSPHYNTIINPYFMEIGLGLGLTSETNNRYTLYLTNHYCTENLK